MIRALFVAAATAAAALVFAMPAAAAPCDNGVMSSVEYALEQIVPDGGLSSVEYALSPGSACSTDADCNSTSQECEGGSCCVKKGEDCTGLGYCCGHPSQGCVNGKCSENSPFP